MKIKLIPLLIIIGCTIGFCQNATGAELGVNVYGLSYHLPHGSRYLSVDWRQDPQTARWKKLNECNAGFGLRLVQETKQFRISAEAGFFKDSFRDRATYYGVGAQVKLCSAVGIGVNCTFYRTRNTNLDRRFFAPIPLLSLRHKCCELHLAYFPKYEQYNPYHIIALYATFYLLRI